MKDGFMFRYFGFVWVVLLCHQAIVVFYVFKCLTGQAAAINEQ